MLRLNPLALAVVFAASTFLTCQPSYAQGEAAQDLQKALESLRGNTVHLLADIAIEEPEEEKGPQGIAGAMVIEMTSDGMGDVETFQGKVDVIVSEDGAIAAATIGGLPQLKVMHDGKRKLFSQAYSGNAYDLPKLVSLLRSTLNMDGVIQETSQAKRVRVTEGDGTKTFRVTIDGEFFEVSEGDDASDPKAKMMAMAMSQMKPKVMEGVMTVTVDGSGKPKGMKYVLQYSDPMKAMMNQAIQGGGGNVQVFGFGGPGKADEDFPGDKVVVTYAVQDGVDGPAQNFVVEALELLKSED